MLKLDEYYTALLKCNKSHFGEILPSDELQELSQSASEDFEEDAARFNELAEKLAIEANQHDAELVLSEIVAIASGMEGLLRNITDDARDLLRRKYRMSED